MSHHQRPNVLLIMADQWRYDYLGCLGAHWVETPNLDRLARRGAVLTHCCSNAPVCAPARIGLATGIQPFRFGALSNHAFLPASTPTYYQHFRNAGYRVGCVGKLDLAKPDPYNGLQGDRPCTYMWGFTDPHECEGKMHAGRSTPDNPLGPYGVYLRHKGLLQRFHDDYARRAAAGYTFGHAMSDSALPTEDFEDVYIGRHAARWLRTVDQDFPWHYFVSFVGPHNPFDPPTDYADRYRDKPMPPAIGGDLEGKPEYIRRKHRGGDEQQVARSRRQYCAAIECIDDQVGEILQALEDSGQMDNTLIFFTADHGEMLGDHGLYTKNVAYEASLRVPLIAAGPGVNQGLVSDALIELNDLNPTMTQMAGLGVMPNIEAMPFTDVLAGDEREHREDCLSQLVNFRCVRTRRYKVIENFGAEPELYDLQEDPDELRNLAPEQPELTHQLMRRGVERTNELTWRW